MAGTTTTELDCLLSKCLAGTNVRPLGVFAADAVPYDKLPLPSASQHHNDAFIVNSDVASRPGQHWVAFLSLQGGRTIEFFDSYALPLADYPDIKTNIPAYLLSRMRKRNLTCLQSLNSASCGDYCILFLTSRAHGASFDHIVSGLYSRCIGDRRARDNYVEKTVRKLRAVVPCIPNRCTTVADQCCLPPLNCGRRL